MSLLDGVLTCDDGTASNLAFKKTFRISVQNRFLRTERMIYWMGTPTTGNKKLDRQLQDNFVEILATPIACVEYYLMGAPIKFRNAAIPNQILTILRQHLKNWDYIANNLYNVTLPPIEELDDINEFCSLIIKYAGAGRSRDNMWTITGRAVRRTGGEKALSALDMHAKRRSIAPPQGDEGVKTGVDSRTEKMMNFRKNFARQKAENS